MNEDAVRNWVRKADNDLKIGADEMDTQEPATDIVCFHMQQCCDKYLKAFLIFHGEEYPRTHRLAALLTLCGRIDPAFQDLSELEVDRLTRYATVLRYGEEFYSPTLAETLEAMELAQKLRAFVRDRLRQGGFVL